MDGGGTLARETLCDIFLRRPFGGAGGARVVTRRNQDFTRTAAWQMGRSFEVVVVSGRCGGGPVRRLCARTFRLTPARLGDLLRAVARGRIANIWLDHGSFGLLAVLLRCVGFLARLRGATAPRLHLFHHNDEARYRREETGCGLALSPGGKASVAAAPYPSLAPAFAGFQQRIGTFAAHRNYHISEAEVGQRSAMVLPPTWPAPRVQIPSALHPATSGGPPLAPGYILLVGSRFFANEHGFRWYIDAVAPLVPRPSLIVGRGMDAAFSSAGPVTVAGFQPDLAPFYAAARIVAVPVFRGAGTKVKLAEAINHGLQVVATPESVEGLVERAELVRSGQLVIARGLEFAEVLADELRARPQARPYPVGRFGNDRWFGRFLDAYHG